MEFIFGAILALSGVSFFGIYCRKKDHLIIDVNNLLKECRSFNCWDDKSETKLGSWVQFDERKLHRQPIKELNNIVAQLSHYHLIHQEMEDGVPFGTYQDET